MFETIFQNGGSYNIYIIFLHVCGFVYYFAIEPGEAENDWLLRQCTANDVSPSKTLAKQGQGDSSIPPSYPSRKRGIQIKTSLL